MGLLILCYLLTIQVHKYSANANHHIHLKLDCYNIFAYSLLPTFPIFVFLITSFFHLVYGSCTQRLALIEEELANVEREYADLEEIWKMERPAPGQRADQEGHRRHPHADRMT